MNVYNKNLFILVRAYCSLGEAYLNCEYFQQALEHFTTALKLNGTLFSDFEETKQFHAHILTLLGRCYMKAGNLNDAMGLLEKSLKMNQTILGEEHISNTSIYTVLAQVHLKKKEYESAIGYLSVVTYT